MREVKLNNHHTFWIYVQEFRELKCVEPDLVTKTRERIRQL